MNQKERNDEILDMLEEAVGITLADFEHVGGYFSYEIPVKQAEKAQFADDCYSEFNYKLGKIMASHPDKPMQEIRSLFFKSVNNWRKDEKKRFFRQFSDGRGRDPKVDIEPEKYKLLRKNNTQAQMAEFLGVARQTVADMDKKFGFVDDLYAMSKNKYFTLRDQYTQEELAEQYGKARQTIAYADDFYGYKPILWRLTTEQYHDLRSRFAQAELAQKFGVSQAQISRADKKYNFFERNLS